MNVIKVRAWDNVKNRMYYVGEEEDVVFSFDSNGIVATDITEDEEEFKTLHHLKYMQFTGLTDKNGNEIYEGDIDSDGRNLSVICYIEKYGAYCAVPSDLYLHEDYEDKVTYEYGYDCYFHNATPERYLNIIGNIYENPELIQTA
ncbi:YopX family protein [Bacillus sp. JJ722]|uniref:YopX family protein n=1 Tax=Bacillus sp. JJ722 TaxID=3122973 RepID=UPI002FFF1761